MQMIVNNSLNLNTGMKPADQPNGEAHMLAWRNAYAYDSSVERHR